jgi:hypothetical protein
MTRIWLECEFDTQTNEVDDKVTVTALSFPGCNQNILQFLSPEKRQEANQLAQDYYYKSIEEKAEVIRAKRGYMEPKYPKSPDNHYE